jgi:hypothetical protein
MSKLSKIINEFFYAWGDNDPKKEVLRYGKKVTLERLHGYDDYVYYRPRRKMAGIILGGLSIIGLSIKGIKTIRTKYNKRKTKKNL